MLVLRPVISLVAVALMLLFVPGVAAAQDATTTTVTGPATAPVHGQTTTVTATVASATAPGVGVVQFFLDGAMVGSPVTLVNGAAQIQTPRLAAGVHTVRADFGPTGPFLASQGQANLTVTRATTTTVVRITPATGVAGQDLAVEAVVSPTTPAMGSPTGEVTLSVDNQFEGFYPLDLGGVARPVVGAGAGSHTISLTYEGDANYVGSGGSATVTNAKAGTFIVLSATPNPAAVGQSVSVSAYVDSFAPSMWWPHGFLSGTVDGVPVPPGAVEVGLGGSAGFVRSFDTPGPHMLTTHFTGDEDFLSADAALAVTVTGSSPYADPFPSTNVSRRPLAARGLTLKATPRRDRRAPYKFTATGTVQLPSSVAKANGCSGRVTVEAKVKAKRVARKTATVTSACTYKTTFSSSRKGTVSITAAFAGNASVSGVSAKAVKVKAG